MTIVSDIEQDIIQAKLDKDVASALDRLNRNKDFNLVIGSGYLTDYALERVNVMYQCKTEEDLNEITRSLNAISHLKGYLELILSKGDTADTRIMQSERELDSLRAEEMQ